MQSFEHTPPEARELLPRRISELGLRLEGSTMEKFVQQLYAELAARGLSQQTAVQGYTALKLRDYGRVDMRLTPDGRIYVIEANPNPWLAPEAELAMAAAQAGRGYVELIGQIVELALARYSG